MPTIDSSFAPVARSPSAELAAPAPAQQRKAAPWAPRAPDSFTAAPATASVRSAARAGRFDALLDAAKSSLSANVERIGGRHYVTAGRGQFKSLWTRDFCHSAQGLLAAGRADVVRDQLGLLLDNQRPSDGLIPRTMDSMDAKQRVVLATLRRLLPFLPNPPLTEQLEPEYQDQHGSLAIDGNLLVLEAALSYVDATGDAAFWKRHEPQLRRALAFYDDRLKDGLISQPPFSDWQDSAKREGRTSYTNLLYAVVLDKLAARGALGVTRARADEVRSKVEATFRDPASGLFRAVEGEPYVSLDANLMALDLGYLPAGSPEARALYEALKRHPLWTRADGLPGGSSWPDYPASWRNLACSLVGLGHYHDSAVWSWLAALSAKVAAKMGDDATALALLDKWTGVVARDGGVAEIYRPEPGLPSWSSLAYDSEQPFTWGAATFLETLADLGRT